MALRFIPFKILECLLILHIRLYQEILLKTMPMVSEYLENYR
jgi:hypothetical protein